MNQQQQVGSNSIKQSKTQSQAFHNQPLPHQKVQVQYTTASAQQQQSNRQINRGMSASINQNQSTSASGGTQQHQIQYQEMQTQMLKSNQIKQNIVLQQNSNRQHISGTQIEKHRATAFSEVRNSSSKQHSGGQISQNFVPLQQQQQHSNRISIQSNGQQVAQQSTQKQYTLMDISQQQMLLQVNGQAQQSHNQNMQKIIKSQKKIIKTSSNHAQPYMIQQNKQGQMQQQQPGMKKSPIQHTNSFQLKYADKEITNIAQSSTNKGTIVQQSLQNTNQGLLIQNGKEGQINNLILSNTPNLPQIKKLKSTPQQNQMHGSHPSNNSSQNGSGSQINGVQGNQQSFQFNFQNQSSTVNDMHQSFKLRSQNKNFQQQILPSASNANHIDNIAVRSFSRDDRQISQTSQKVQHSSIPIQPSQKNTPQQQRTYKNVFAGNNREHSISSSNNGASHTHYQHSTPSKLQSNPNQLSPQQKLGNFVQIDPQSQQVVNTHGSQRQQHSQQQVDGGAHQGRQLQVNQEIFFSGDPEEGEMDEDLDEMMNEMLEQDQIDNDLLEEEYHNQYPDEEVKNERQVARKVNSDNEVGSRQQHYQQQQQRKQYDQAYSQQRPSYQAQLDRNYDQYNDQTLKRQNSYSPSRVAQQMAAKKDRKIPGSVLKPHAENVHLIYSAAVGQSTPLQRVFFPYPNYCFVDNNFQTTLNIRHHEKHIRNFQRLKVANQNDMKDKNMTLGFKIHESTHVYNSVVNSLKTGGCRIVGPGSSKWNVMWTGIVKTDYLKEASKYQKINHFPQSFQVGRKDLMWKNIQRMKKIFQGTGEYNFCPKTYLFPEDYRKFCMDREQDNYKHMYIMKPNASSCGRGIKVIGAKQQIQRKAGYLVSQYVANPHLINGLKYDLRIYVVVTCFDPLKIYLFKDGLARFATQKYSNNPKNIDKRFVHLTNYSVNKKNEDYVKNNGANQNKAQDDMQEQNEGEDGNAESDASKWNFIQLKRHFEKIGVNFQAVFGRIKDVIIKTLISIEPHIVNAYSRCTKHKNVCFEIYGFDILLDSKLKPWILEVNISPSLSSSSPLDKKIKTILICDTLNLIGVVPYDRKQYEREVEMSLKKRLLGLDKKQNQQNQQVTEDKIVRLLKAFLRDEQQASSNHFNTTQNQNQGTPSDDDVQMIIDYEEEQNRMNNFERIFPTSQNIGFYSQFFEFQRTANELLWKYIKGLAQNQIHYQAVPLQLTHFTQQQPQQLRPQQQSPQHHHSQPVKYNNYQLPQSKYIVKNQNTSQYTQQQHQQIDTTPGHIQHQQQFNIGLHSQQQQQNYLPRFHHQHHQGGNSSNGGSYAE